MLYGYLDPIDFGILYDVIEYYNKLYGLNATDAVRFYEKFRHRAVLDSAYDEE